MFQSAIELSFKSLVPYWDIWAQGGVVCLPKKEYPGRLSSLITMTERHTCVTRDFPPSSRFHGSRTEPYYLSAARSSNQSCTLYAAGSKQEDERRHAAFLVQARAEQSMREQNIHCKYQEHIAQLEECLEALYVPKPFHVPCL